MSNTIYSTTCTPIDPKKFTKDLVPNSRKIAGLELSEDITNEALKEALELNFAGEFKSFDELKQYDFKVGKVHSFLWRGAFAPMAYYLTIGYNIPGNSLYAICPYKGTSWYFDLTNNRASIATRMPADIIKIEDDADYFGGSDVYDALQEIGATLDGVEDFLASI